MSLPELYKDLHGVKMPSDVEVRILKIEKALKIKDNDALWQVIFALDYYQCLYSEFPEKIKKQTLESVAEVRKLNQETINAAKIEIQRAEKEAEASMKEKLRQTIFELVEQAIYRTERKTYAETLNYKAWKWGTVGVLFVVFAFFTGFYIQVYLTGPVK